MSGADKFVLHNGRAFIASAAGPKLTPTQAVEQTEIIRGYLRDRWGYDDAEPLGLVVTRLLDRISDEELDDPASA